MSTQDSYLPPALSPDTISQLIVSLELPTPTSIRPFQVTAAFHSIYLIHFAAPTSPISTSDGLVLPVNADGSLTLILRVSGRQLPTIKTQNEVGVMTWVRRNTTIPIPAIIRYDSTDDNIIGHEFTLLEKAVSYTHLTLPTIIRECRSRWSPYH